MEPGRYFDGRTGLHLLVKKNGRKYWVYRFTHNSTRHDKGLGAFPKMPLEAAREAAMEARIMVVRRQNIWDSRGHNLRKHWPHLVG